MNFFIIMPEFKHQFPRLHVIQADLGKRMSLVCPHQHAWTSRYWGECSMYMCMTHMSEGYSTLKTNTRAPQLGAHTTSQERPHQGTHTRSHTSGEHRDTSLKCPTIPYPKEVAAGRLRARLSRLKRAHCNAGQAARRWRRRRRG